jgi:ferredoxin--NADP+ reductase
MTYGASRDRPLGIPGEDLPGSIAATDFVNWYTGHPDMPVDAFTDLLARATSVAVIGVGNVAVDVTRVLAKTPSEIEHTDMPDHVFAALRASAVRDIHVVGRRGPAQATWTTKELRELGELAECTVDVETGALPLDDASAARAATDRAVGRNVAVVEGWAGQAPADRPRHIHLHFLRRPVEILGEDRVTGLVVERTELDAESRASGTGETETITVDVVIRSVGYRGTPLPGAPFDDRSSVIPNDGGRVLDGGEPVPGLYVAGWIKRGPTGIIGTNKKDAVQTVGSLLADAEAGLLTAPVTPGIDELLAERGVQPVTTEGWRLIDAAERALGAQAGRDRTTLHDRSDLLRAAGVL